jgi:hypothetical protein
MTLSLDMEVSHSGLVRSLGKRVRGQTLQGFESPHFLHHIIAVWFIFFTKIKKYCKTKLVY